LEVVGEGVELEFWLAGAAVGADVGPRVICFVSILFTVKVAPVGGFGMLFREVSRFVASEVFASIIDFVVETSGESKTETAMTEPSTSVTLTADSSTLPASATCF
jgi:hypothetical protein